MIFRLSTNFGQAQGAVGVKGRVGQHSDEIGLTDVIGTRAGDENTAGAEHLQRAEVQFFIAADGGIEVALALREGGRIEDDRVIAPTGCRVILEQIESVGFDPLDLRLARVAAIKSCVAVCNFKRGPGAVDTGYMGTAGSEMEREAPLIAEDIEGFAAGILGSSGVVLALVEEGSGFLAFVRVEVELDAIHGEDRRGFFALHQTRDARWQLFELPDARVYALDD